MTTLTFQDKTLHVIDRNGDKWLTVNDIAAALYPTNQRGSQSETPFVSRVRMLYKRNAEEFSDSMTALVDIETEGGVQKIRVFSLRGAHLLGMLARTKKAKEFRRWVLDIIEQHRHQASSPPNTIRRWLPLRSHKRPPACTGAVSTCGGSAKQACASGCRRYSPGPICSFPPARRGLFYWRNP